jgi:threonine dehydrogenase-like Zn-dependent dehydrogenase
VLVIEPAPPRREAAAALGFTTAGGAQPIGGALADVVFDAAGVPEVARQVTGLARPGGTIVITGLHGRPTSTPRWSCWPAAPSRSRR